MVEKVIINPEMTLDEVREQAIKEGKLKGKMEVAKNMLLLDLDIDTIVRATGLRFNDIEFLKKQLKLREKAAHALEDANPREVDKMITNLEIVLNEMEENALLKGKMDKLEITKNLLLLNVNTDIIIKATGLTADEIESLKKEIHGARHLTY
uniref:hypothetical protein n=1 Tax=Desulfofundulus thermocisternus TaxID=42471 RepID=UPI000A466BEF|nr:hypothetical protein [Desulfofundulus thermocisternus]